MVSHKLLVVYSIVLLFVSCHPGAEYGIPLGEQPENQARIIDKKIRFYLNSNGFEELANERAPVNQRRFRKNIKRSDGQGALIIICLIYDLGDLKKITFVEWIAQELSEEGRRHLDDLELILSHEGVKVSPIRY